MSGSASSLSLSSFNPKSLPPPSFQVRLRLTSFPLLQTPLPPSPLLKFQDSFSSESPPHFLSLAISADSSLLPCDFRRFLSSPSRFPLP
ncbi:unnamed protein product [Brassica rapa subsp. trilocularis]